MLYLIPIIAMLYLIPIIVMLYLIPLFTMLYSTLIFAMIHLTRDIWHRHSVFTPTLGMLYLTPVFDMLYICHMIYNTWYLAPDTWHLYYLTYSWLLCDQTSGTPVSPVLLYSWTPEKGWLLILYSWYYTPVNSCSWIIMVIMYTLVDIIFGQYA